MKIKIFIITLAAFLFLLCSKDERPKKDRLKIAVSIYPIYDIVKNLSLENTEVIYIVPPGANPHTYEPVPSKVKSIKDADLFIGISKEFDSWIEKFLPRNITKKYISSVGHYKNPHIWLSINKSKKISRVITESLILIDPNQKKEYSKNPDIYLKKITKTELKILSQFENIKENRIIQYHPAWNYFAEDFDLDIISTIQSGHGKSPSLKKFKEIIERAKKTKTHIIVTGLNVSNSSVNTLSKEIKGMIVKLDTMGNPDKNDKSTYLKLMINNGKKLSEALKVK